MKTRANNQFQKISIVIHLVSLFGWFSCLELRNELGSWDQILLGIFLGLWMLTFYFSFNKTGLFTFTHTKVKDLDERELVVASNALRFAYSAFSIFTVILLFLITLSSLTLGVIIAGGMLYLAHILPAVYLGWKGEKR